jgi:hypothetical protein
LISLCHHLLQAPRCTVVTSSRRLPKKEKAWLQNSDAEHWAITNRIMKRLRSGRKNCRLECGSVLNNLASADGFSWMKNWVIRRPRLSGSLSIYPRIPHSTGVRLSAAAPSPVAENDGMQPPLRQCQRDCLDACAKGARIIEMACGTGKTRVIQELVSKVSGRVPSAFDSIQFMLVSVPGQS